MSLAVRRAAALACSAWLVLAASAAPQIVPLQRCHAAMPCSIPFGLRPADSVAHSPYTNSGTGGAAFTFSAGVEEGLKLRLVQPPVSEDPAESAARLYVKKNPLKPTATPTPRPK